MNKLELKSLLDGIGDPILVIDPMTYRVLLANRAAREASPCAEREPVTCHALSHCRDRPCHEAGEDCPLERALATRRPVRVKHTHIEAGRGTRIVDILASPIVDEAGDVIAVVESMRDITEMEQARALADSALATLEQRVALATHDLERSNDRLRAEVAERVQAEHALVASERRHRRLFELLADAALLVSPDTGRIVKCNAQAQALLGDASTQVLGAELTGFLDVGDHPCGALQRGDADVVRMPIDVVRPDGVRVPVHLSSVPFDDGPDSLRLCMLHDLTEVRAAQHERDRLRDQLVVAQKLEAVGQLAGGIAHDFSNMLNVILLLAHRMLERQCTEEERTEGLRQVVKASERATDLTRQLLAFSRRQVLQEKRTTLNAVVSEVLEMLARAFGDTITVVVALDPEPTEVWVDPGQLAQVLMNLALNARDAMGEHGTLTVRTASRTLEPRDPALTAEMAPGRYAVMSVSDSGHGMDPHVLSHLFEPFFSTKPVGKGTGLGLSTAYGIIAQSGGTIRVTSSPGEGALFDVLLPEATQDPVHSGISEICLDPTTASLPTSGGRLLVVDDEAMVRRLHARILRDEGYEVFEAESASRALEILSETEDVDLLITDLAMPDLDGMELARRARDARPALRVLFVTAYASEDELVQPGVALLRKPFGPDKLVRHVASALSGSGELPSAAALGHGYWAR